MLEAPTIESIVNNNNFNYVLKLKNTGRIILKWRCETLSEAWRISYEINRILREGEND